MLWRDGLLALAAALYVSQYPWNEGSVDSWNFWGQMTLALLLFAPRWWSSSRRKALLAGPRAVLALEVVALLFLVLYFVLFASIGVRRLMLCLAAASWFVSHVIAAGSASGGPRTIGVPADRQ